VPRDALLLIICSCTIPSMGKSFEVGREGIADTSASWSRRIWSCFSTFRYQMGWFTGAVWFHSRGPLAVSCFITSTICSIQNQPRFGSWKLALRTRA
jgi:hypothetical protein